MLQIVLLAGFPNPPASQVLQNPVKLFSTEEGSPTITLQNPQSNPAADEFLALL